MARKTIIPMILFGFLTVTILTMCAPHVFGCGTSYYYSVFTYNYPDKPLDDFVRGNLGIINPNSPRGYLYVVYRYLSNKPFNSDEQKSILTFYSKRKNGEFQNEAIEEMSKAWVEARKMVPNSKTIDIKIYASLNDDYSHSFLNISPDAFRVATETLKDRIAIYGAGSQIIRDWLNSQDIVFSNPVRDQKKGGYAVIPDSTQGLHSLAKPVKVKKKGGYAVIPDSPDPELPPLAKADRMYQRASAHFYAGNYDDAVQLYREIWQDFLSPWSRTARFMIARCLLRKAILNSSDHLDKNLVKLAEADLKQILKDQNLKDFHASAARLLAYLYLHCQPEERLYELSQTLLQATNGDNLFQDLWDYTVLLDKYEQKTCTEDENRTEMLKDFTRRPDEVRKDDMTDWIFTFQSTSPKSLEHALIRWRQTKSLPWLIACLSKIRGDDTNIIDVLSASENISVNSPGYVMVIFHRVRLLAESGNRDKAREAINDILSRRESLSQSVLNLLFAERTSLAKNMDDFLTYAQRKPATIILWSPDEVIDGLNQLKDIGHYKKGERLLDADIAIMLNRDFSLDLLKTIAVSYKLDTNIRREVALRVWTRAVLMGRNDIGQDIIPVLEELVPEIRKEDLQGYIQAKEVDAQRFAVAYLLLKNPGLTPIMGAGLPREKPLDQIGSYKNNDGRWWCDRPSPEYSYKTESSLQERAAIPGISLQLLYPDKKIPTPTFLEENERKAAIKDWKILSALDAAPNFLTKQVLAWAQNHPDDPRVPEALHLAVRATQYGCTNNATSELSKKAFQMLHRRYPKSDWATKTKYWY